MREFLIRMAPIVTVFLICVALLMLVNRVVEPRISANEETYVQAGLRELVGGKSIGSAAEDNTESVSQYWPVSGPAGEALGIVALCEVGGYQSRIRLLVGTSFEGDVWGVKVLSSYESAWVERTLNSRDTFSALVRPDETDALAGATVTEAAFNRAIRDSVFLATSLALSGDAP